MLLYSSSLQKLLNALVAQLDRVSDYESEGQGFESLQARQTCGEWMTHRGFFLYRRKEVPHCETMYGCRKPSPQIKEDYWSGAGN